MPTLECHDLATTGNSLLAMETLSDVQDRPGSPPIFHHTRDAVEAYLIIV
jgi:hypothetical protein